MQVGTGRTLPHALPGRPVDRLMWISADRLFYVGLLGVPSVRTMGCLIAYVALEGSIRIKNDTGEWQSTQLAVVPPCVPHRVLSESPHIDVIKLEAETVDLAALPDPLRGCGAIDAPWFVERVREGQRTLCARSGSLDFAGLDFDALFFDGPLPPRRIDRRI